MRIAIALLSLCSCVFAGPPMGLPVIPPSANLQAAIDTGAPLVFVPKGNYELDAPLRLRSNLTLVFEPGTTIINAVGKFQGRDDSLVVLEGVQNVTINADGAILKMTKADFRDPIKYPIQSEWRHVLDVRGSKNVTINGGTYSDSGGDGLYLGPWVQTTTRTPNSNITVRRAIFDNNFRQGVSVLSCIGCVLEDSVLSRTNGTSPQSGIDFEPELGDSFDMIVRRCRSEGNRGPAYMVSLQKTTTALLPAPRVAFESCTYSGVPADQPTMRLVGIFNAAAPTGYLMPNLPAATTIRWDSLEWKK